MRRRLIFALLLMWLAAVVACYFIAHKPADNVQLSALADWVPGLILAGMMTLLAGALGYRFLRGWGTPDQRVTLAIVLGLGIFSAAILLLGLIGLVRSEAAWLLVMIALIVSWRSLKPLAADLRIAIADLRPRGWFTWLCAIYCTVALTTALLHALAPATAWDGLAYHLSGPQLYQQAGRITQPIDNPYLGFPQLGEMLFLQLQLLGGQTPSVLHWLFALLTAILVGGEARRMWREPIGWAAAAIWLSAETVILEAGWPYIDLILAFCVLAATVCVQAWRDDRTWRSLILAAVFTGFAMASKYSAAPVAVAFALIVLWRSSAMRWRTILIFGGVACLVASPWYLKSWVLLGNPFYPFVFGGVHWDALRGELFQHSGTGLLATAPLRLLSAPWDATMWGVEGKLGYAATIGPLFLLLTPLTLLGWRTFDRVQRSRLIDQLIVIGVVYATWLYGLASSDALLQSRLLIPIFPLFAVIGAGAFQVVGHWDLPKLSLRRLASVLTALVLIMTGVKVLLDVGQGNLLPVLTGGISRDEYLTNALGWYYEAVKDINQLEPGAITLFLWEPRGLYCRTTCWPDAMIDHFVYARRAGRSAHELANDWRAQGVEYVLFWKTGYEAAQQLALNRITPDDEQALYQIMQDDLVLIKDYGGAYQLYRLRSS